MPLNEDIKVGLLIGLNCSRAIKPLEVIPGKQDDPYAKKTALGWGIIGAVGSSKQEDAETDFSCNRIVAREVHEMSNKKTCYFAFKTQAKEMFSPSDVSEMFTLDFSERQADEKPLSVEVREGIHPIQVREGIHQLEDDHYEMPLPLKSEIVELPNRRRSKIEQQTRRIAASSVTTPP